MRKINKEHYKIKVLQTLRRVGKPIWLSDLSRKYGLPDVSLHRRAPPRPTQQALGELESSGKIRFLLPRYYKPDSAKLRRKIMLGGSQNPRRYFEVELMDRIVELEQQLENTTSYNITKHNMKTPHRSIEQWKKDIIGVLQRHPVCNFKDFARYLKVPRENMYQNSPCRVVKALHELVTSGAVIAEPNGKRSFLYNLRGRVPNGNKQLPISIKEVPQDCSVSHDSEDKLIDALNSFLSDKKKQMANEIASDLDKTKAERDYFENLCKDKQVTIDKLETKQARKFLNW